MSLWVFILLVSQSLNQSFGSAPKLTSPHTPKNTQHKNRYLRFSLGWETVARRRVLVVVAAAALIGPVAYLDIAYGLHGGDKPLTDYMFQARVLLVSVGCSVVGGWVNGWMHA